jgi:hypothetical protein
VSSKSTPDQPATIGEGPVWVSSSPKDTAEDVTPPFTDEPSPHAQDAPSAEPFGRQPYQDPLPDPVLGSDTVAMRAANLAPAACRAELHRRNLPFRRDRRPTPGVASAFRVTDRLDGVRIIAPGWRSPYGVFDCRLSLVLEEAARVLSSHGVSAMHVGTAYRRASRLRRRKLSQHAHALAMDVVGFTLQDGRTLLVERDWHGQIGSPPCGPGSIIDPPGHGAVTLRNLVCDLARQGLFHTILTPNYDEAHHDHVHLDIRRGSRRRILR